MKGKGISGESQITSMQKQRGRPTAESRRVKRGMTDKYINTGFRRGHIVRKFSRGKIET